MNKIIENIGILTIFAIAVMPFGYSTNPNMDKDTTISLTRIGEDWT